jgi:hypothetical protein
MDPGTQRQRGLGHRVIGVAMEMLSTSLFLSVMSQWVKRQDQ